MGNRFTFTPDRGIRFGSTDNRDFFSTKKKCITPLAEATCQFPVMEHLVYFVLTQYFFPFLVYFQRDT